MLWNFKRDVRIRWWLVIIFFLLLWNIVVRKTLFVFEILAVDLFPRGPLRPALYPILLQLRSFISIITASSLSFQHWFTKKRLGRSYQKLIDAIPNQYLSWIVFEFLKSWKKNFTNFCELQRNGSIDSTNDSCLWETANSF